MLENLKESCGVFGAFDYEGGQVFPSLYWAMISQNHRGHQSYGFTTFDGDFKTKSGLGLLPVTRDKSEDWFCDLPGDRGIGHVRYATSGEREKIEDVQPYICKHDGVKIALGYNGNLVNNIQLRKDLKERFGGLSSTSDTELLCKKLLEGLEGGDLVSAVELCMKEIEGSFSVVGLDQDGRMFAFRDPLGNRPFCYGKKKNGKIQAVSSESVGLSINGFDYYGEIKPGELLIFTEEGLQRERVVKRRKKAFCSFEYAYFARPDSIFDGKPVYKVREEFGKNLARENKDLVQKADLVLSIPQTADDAAYGFHIESGLPWERAVRKHRYVTSRSFISPPDKRSEIIDKKINVDWGRIRGKNIAVVEDSIVRGSTSKGVVKKMKNAGVGDIYLFVTFPRIISPCFYGIDMTTYRELIGSTHTPDEIAEELGIENVRYQSLESFIKSTGLKRNEICLACVTEDYPTPLAQKLANKFKSKFERGEREPERIYEGVV